MSIKVAINGFGRIGRLALRESWGCADFDIVHINEMAGDAQSAAHLLRFDSVHGQWDKLVSVDNDHLMIMTIKLVTRKIRLSPIPTGAVQTSISFSTVLALLKALRPYRPTLNKAFQR